MIRVGDYVRCRRGIMSGRIGKVSDLNPHTLKYIVAFECEDGTGFTFRRYSSGSLTKCINPAIVSYSVGDEVICVNKDSRNHLRRGIVTNVLYEYDCKRRIFVKFGNDYFSSGMELSDITSTNIPEVNIGMLI